MWARGGSQVSPSNGIDPNPFLRVSALMKPREKQWDTDTARLWLDEASSDAVLRTPLLDIVIDDKMFSFADGRKPECIVEFGGAIENQKLSLASLSRCATYPVQLQRRGVHVLNQCPCCNADGETTCHILLTCSRSQEIIFGYLR